MLILKLCQKACPEKIPALLPEHLGDGADGEVFQLADAPHKVIKFSALYQSSCEVRLEFSYRRIEAVLSHLKNNPSPTYAKVYDYAELGTYDRQVYWGQDKCLLYYYTMEKLWKISEDENKVFHSILSHEDRGVTKDYSPAKIKEMLLGMKQRLDFDLEKVIFFCDNFGKTPILHHDIHTRNIMKDADGNFKLIDFDRANYILGDNYGKD